MVGMQARSWSDYAWIGLRVSTGLWFAWLGAMKLFLHGPPAFSRQVAEFRILMDPWNLPVAYLVPWVELVAGLMLLAQWWPRGAVRVLGVLTLVFLFANAQALWLGFEPDCGCFGDAFKLGVVPKLWLIGAQLGVLVVLVAGESRARRGVFGGRRMRLPGF